VHVLHQPFDEGVLLRARQGDVLPERGSGARRGQPRDLFEIAADPCQAAEEVVGFHVVAGLGALAEGGFADEACGLQAAGLRTFGDTREFLRVEAEKLRRGAAGSGGHCELRGGGTPGRRPLYKGIVWYGAERARRQLPSGWGMDEGLGGGGVLGP